MAIDLSDIINYFRKKVETQTFLSHCILSTRKVEQCINAIKNLTSTLNELKNQNAILQSCILKSKTDMANDIASHRYQIINSTLLPETHSKKVLILEWYGAGNYGDELMLSTFLEREEFKNYDISVLLDPYCHHHLDTYNKINCYFPPTNYDDLSTISDYFDIIIVGGGAHIDDVEITDLSFIPYIALELSIVSIKKSKDVRWIAVSANNELTNKQYISKLKFVVENAKEFSVRDNFSLTTLKRVGLVDNITYRHDLGLDYNLSKKTLIITIASFASESTIIDIVNEAKRFVIEADEEWVICFLPFFVGNDNDVIFIQKILSKIDLNGIDHTVLPNFNSIGSMLQLMKGGDAFINMKYHASLISLKLNIPTISFCVDSHRHYYNKMRSLCSLFPENILLFESSYRKGDILKALIDLSRNHY